MNTLILVKKIHLCIYVLLVCIILSNTALSITSEQFSKISIDKSMSQPQIIGPSKGEIYKYYSFNANCLDSINEQIWYRFDFNGETTDWQQSPEISFSWIEPSIVDIKVQTKNSKSALSLWSQPHSIQIERTNSKPSTPLILGDSNGSINQSLTFKTKSIDSDSNFFHDNLQYQFDWGDSTKSDWINGQNQWAEKSHSWLKPGQFCMTVQSKDNSGLLSGTSPCKTVTIIGPNQSPNTPSLAGISIGYINQSYLFHATAFDDNEDNLEYSFVIYLQDQTFATDWQESPDFSWTWHSPGTFCVKAMVRDAPGRAPIWSKCHDVKILSEPTSCQVDIVSPNPDNEHKYNICNGGYVITSGTFKITWQDMDGNKDDDIKRIEAFYAIANNEWQILGVDNAPNGDYDSQRWTIPQNFFHERVRFKISASYDSGCMSQAISKPIQLHNSNPPEIIIEQPKTGVYYVGEPVPIKWKANCPDDFSITRIELKLIADGSNRGSFTELSGQDALKSFYSWKPRSSHITNQGQIKIIVWCSNCIDGEAVSSATFQIKYRPDPSNPWKEAQRPMKIPNPSNYQLPSIIEPDIHVDANQTIHLVSCYIALKDSPTLPIIGESQLYYRKQISGVWFELENATSYPVWQSPDYTWSDNQYQVRYPKITADSNGQPHIVYEFESPNNQTDIMYITKNETGWTKPYNISNTSDNKSIDAQITIDLNNAITIFWEERKSGIYFRKYSNGKWSPVEHVPIIYDNYNLNLDENHIIHMVGHNKENRAYYYRVKAVSNCSQSNWSQPVKVRIVLPRYTLNVQSVPHDGGYIADHQVNHFIFCPMNQCVSEYYEDSLITLFATPYPEFSIKEWTGCEKIQNNQCIVTMNKLQNVRVSFECNHIQPPEIKTSIKEIKPNEPYIIVWNEVPGAIQYQLEESTSPDFSKNIHTINTTDLSQIFIKEQLEQSEFFYRASAMRSCGSQSEWSNVIRLNKDKRSKQNIDLQSGWNWISICVNPNDNNWTIHSVLSAISSHAEKIISQKGYSEFNQEWFGTITHIQPALMYTLKMKVPDQLIIEGNPLKADYEFALQKGWNWIGFWKDQPMSLNTALQEIGDSGEKFISQNGFAEYHQGWWGSCDMLIPGNGYMLKLKEPKKLRYSFNSGLNRKNKSNNNVSDKISDWTIQASNYELQGTLTIQLECRTVDNISENDWLGAFINNECRGAVNAVQTPNDMLFFLQVWANDNNLPMTFKFFSANENRVYPVQTSPILFIANMEMGKIDAPVVFKVDDWYEDVNKDDILDLKDVILILKNVGEINDE